MRTYSRGTVPRWFASKYYYGYCGIPWHSDREAVSSTLVDVVTRASGYPGTRVLPRCEEDDAIFQHTELNGQTQTQINRIV